MMMTYPFHGQQQEAEEERSNSPRSQFKLFSSDSRRRRRAAALFYKNNSMRRSWLMLSYPTLSTNVISKPHRSSASSKSFLKSHPLTNGSIRPTTSCSTYSSYRSPAVSVVIDSPVIYPKINPQPTSSSSASASFTTSSNLETSSSSEERSSNSSPSILNHHHHQDTGHDLSCFPICSSSPPSSSCGHSSGSPTSLHPSASSSIFHHSSGNSVNGKNNNHLLLSCSFSNNIPSFVDHSYDLIGEASSNKGSKVMASNRVCSSDDQLSETSSSMAHGDGKSNGMDFLNERLKRTSVDKAMNESASSSSQVFATKTTFSQQQQQNPVKGSKSRERSSSSSSKQGSCSSFIESSRELVQSLFNPSPSSFQSSSSFLSKIKEHEKEGDNGLKDGHQQQHQRKEEVGKDRKIDEAKDVSKEGPTKLGHQYNNNYHEDGNSIEQGKLVMGKDEVNGYNRNNNHHHHNLTTNGNKNNKNRKDLPRKLLVSKNRNKNHFVFFSPWIHPQVSNSHLLPLSSVHSSQYPVSSNLLNQVASNNHQAKHTNQEKKEGQSTNGSKPLPILHFKDDEPTPTTTIFNTLNGHSLPSQHPGHVDSGSCKDCNTKNIEDLKRSPATTQQELNVTISQSFPHSTASSGNSSPPESLDSCSLFCSTSSSPSSSPTTVLIPSSNSNGNCPQFQKQGILKSSNKGSNSINGGCKNCKLVTSTIHDHLERLTINGPNDKSSGVMILPSSSSSPTSSDQSSPSSCCSSSFLKDQVQSRTGSSSSSSSIKKVHFADDMMCYETNYYQKEEEECIDEERRVNKSSNHVNGNRIVDSSSSNPTKAGNHRSLSSTDPHSSSLVIVSEKVFPSPTKRCTFKEISV